MELKPFFLVPARGGSKRFPRKNLALLAGQSLLARTIATARASGLHEEVWVSSEDNEILQAAKEAGGQSLPRLPELAGDQVTLLELCLHVVESDFWQQRTESALYLLLPTSPFRSTETMRRAWMEFTERKAQSLLSMVPLEHPPQWSLQEADGWLQPMFPAEFDLPRGKLSQGYRHDGGHLILDITFLKEARSFFGAKTVAFPVVAEEAVDINEPMDLAWAEFLWQKKEVT